MYQVVRIFYKGEVEQHSIEERATFREALSRFHSIAAADIGNSDITYSYTTILDDSGHDTVSPSIFNTVMDEEMLEPVPPFQCAVLRVRVKNGQRSTSVEFKTYQEAIKRFFNILAVDLEDESVTYNLCTIVNSEGEILETRVFQ